MNEQLHERTVLACARAACSPFITEDDLALLCYHAGIRREELRGVKVSGYTLREREIQREEIEIE